MPYLGDFNPPQTTSETENLTLDFTADLGDGEAITSATWAITVVSGTDAAPDTRKHGSVVIDGALITQAVTPGVNGVVYRHTATVVTDRGQTLQNWAHLAVADPTP